MKESNFEIVQSFITESFDIAKNDIDCQILLNDKAEKLDKVEAQYHYDSMLGAINIITDYIIKNDSSKRFIELSNSLLPAFNYCFDKSIELVYNLRTKQEKKVVKFNFNELYEGMGGSGVPEYIQLKVTSVIIKIAYIHSKLCSIISANELYYKEMKFPLKDQLTMYLLAATYIGADFCLHINLNNTDEMDSFLEN